MVHIGNIYEVFQPASVYDNLFHAQCYIQIKKYCHAAPAVILSFQDY